MKNETREYYTLQNFQNFEPNKRLIEVERYKAGVVLFCGETKQIANVLRKDLYIAFASSLIVDNRKGQLMLPF